MSSPKYMVRCDMEGVSGVISYAQVEPGKPEYAEAREAFMREILALVDGLREGGAGEIVIYDEHWFGRNLQIDRLPQGVIGICGKPPYRPEWAGGLDETFAGLVLHGLHAKAGTGHLLHHTYEPDFLDIEINGLSVGEIGMEAAIAGDCHVALHLIVADSAGVDEAERLVPGVEGVQTKISQGADGAACFSLEDVLPRIKESARRIVAHPPECAPLKFSPPVEVAMEFRDGPYREALRRRAGSRMASPSRLILRGPSVLDVWSEYWAMKLLTQKDLLHAH